MTREDKELLLKYLCAALPYDIKLIVTELNKDVIFNIKGIDLLTNNVICVKSNSSTIFNVPIKSVKLYLRPMSSMTEEERKEFDSISNEGFGKALDSQIAGGSDLTVMSLEITASCNNIQYMLEHHFDFMGLIPKDLAVEVTKENNPYESNM